MNQKGRKAFSWEEKVFPNKSRSQISSLPTKSENRLDESSNKKNIPLPPCGSQPPPLRRSMLWKPFRRQNDPFLLAYKECTKTPSSDKKMGVGFNSFATKTKFRISCKTSIDVRDDHFLRPSVPPQLPHATNPSFSTHT